MTAPKDDKQTQGQQPPSTQDSGGDGKLNAGTLRSWIVEEIKKALPGTSGQPSTKDTAGQSGGQPPADVQSEVQKALQQLKAKEDRQKRDERVDKMLEEFEKPPPEVAPKEIRRVHRLMGWGE